MASRPVHQRASRYVVFPDGSLHVSFDPAVTASTLPPFARMLRRSEIEALWGLLLRLDLADPAVAPPVGNTRSLTVEPGGWNTSAVIQVNGRRAWLKERGSPSSATKTPLTRLTRALAQLAWAGDDPDVSLMRLPMRYDFGPDPYARYRTNQP